MNFARPSRVLVASALLASLLLPFASLAPLATPAQVAAHASQLLRYPYLTDVTGPYAAVNWATDTSGTTASVTYGLAPSCATYTVPATRTLIKVNSVSEYQWKANISGLASDTQYCYRVFLGTVDLLGTDPSPVFRSQLAAGSTTPFSFAVFGDWGLVDSSGQNPDQANLMQQIANSGARFAVGAGDTAYPGGNQTNYGDLVQVGSGLSEVFGPSFWTVPGSSIPLFNIAGNHGFSNDATLVNWPQDQTVAASGGRYQFDTYCCTYGTSSASYPSMWYAFDVGNARFYMLTATWANSNVGTADIYANDYANHWTPTSPEYQWLQQDLQTHPTELKFAFYHFPMYSDNKSEKSDTYLQGPSSLEGLLHQYGVDIGFSGHAHMYQRNTAPQGGFVTYITGGGGATLEPIGPCTAGDAYGIGWSPTKKKGYACGAAKPPTAASQVYHFLLVTVNGSKVTVAPTDSTGHQFDVVTYNFNPGPTDKQAPTAPTGLTATAFSSSRVDLTWTAATDNVGVTAYDVYRDGAVVASLGNVTSYSDQTVAASTAYTYYVVARDAAGNSSPPSASASVTTPAPPPTLTFSPTDDTYIQASQPTKTAGSSNRLQVDGSPQKDILLRFNVTGLSGSQVLSATLRLYNTDSSPAGGDIYTMDPTTSWSEATATWSNAPPVNSGVITSIGNVNSGSWYDIDLSSLVTGDGVISLRISSTNSNGANYASKEDSAGNGPQLIVAYAAQAPAAPTNLVATPGDGQVSLTWAAVSGATSYTVERSGTSGGPYSTIASPTGASYTDTGLANGTPYYYVVTASNSSGTSAPSNEASATPAPPPLPAAPTNLAATAGDGQVSLTWDPVSTATSYNVKRSTTSGGPYSTVTSPTGTSFTDTGVANGTTYYYVVSAVNGTGEGPDSSEASATPTAPPVRTFVFSDGFESGDLSQWSSSAGLSVESTRTNTGTYAAEGSTTTGNVWAKKLLGSTYTDAYYRVYFYLVSGYSNQLTILRVLTASDSGLAYLFMTTGGHLGLRNEVAGATTSGPSVTMDAWHSIELHLVVNGTSSTTEVWLDGVPVSALSTTANFGTTGIGELQIGDTAGGSRTYDIAFDDVAFDTQAIGTATN